MPYTPYYTTWTDSPSLTTPIVAAALNNIENGLVSVSQDYRALDYGADPTGAVDSSAAVQAAHDALPSTGGTIWLPPGVLKFTSGVTVTKKFVSIRGAGRWATQVNYTGSGDCLRVYNTDITGARTGGGLYDFTIDGTSAGDGACGLHYGDMRAGELRIAVENFTGVGSINVHFDNQYAWTEECHGYLWLTNGTSNLVFDVTAPTGGSYTATHASPAVFTCTSPTFANGTQVVLSGGTAPTGFTNGTGYFVVNASGTTFQLSATSGGSAINSSTTGSGTVTQATSQNSFGYNTFDVEILAKQNQDGVVLQNGALYYNSKLAVKGNFQGTSGTNTSAVIRVTGTMPVGHIGAGNGSKINKSRLEVLAECTSATGSNGPQTINFGTLGTNTILGCEGILDFSMGSLAFAQSNWTATGGAGSFIFTGPIAGDFNLNNTSVGTGSANSISLQGGVSYSKSLLNVSNGNTNVNSGDFFSSTLTGNITINLNPGGSSTFATAQRKTIILTQAASGGPYTVTWPSTGSPTTSNPTIAWAGGAAPSMPTAASAVMVVTLITYDGATWFGQVIQPAVPSWSQLASTGTAGYTLVNGTGNILTYTAPSDGALHRVQAIWSLRVTSGETGGQLSITCTFPDASAQTFANAVSAGGSATGAFPGDNTYLIQAGTTFTVKQNSALTAGAAILWAELWGQ